MEMQNEREHQTKDIEQFKNESNKFLAEMNRRINDGKVQHENLTKEVTYLARWLPSFWVVGLIPLVNYGFVFNSVLVLVYM